jgi:1,4-alpha-glucan branching enzyme
MGGEIGQWREWNHDQSLDWDLLQWQPHQKLQKFVQDLNRFYTSHPALYEVDFHYTGFEWIDFRDSDKSIASFLRRAKNSEEFIVFIYNFTPIVQRDYRIGVPVAGYYQEVINSDAETYGGRNFNNAGGVLAEPTPWQGRPFSLKLTLPPLAALVLMPER